MHHNRSLALFRVGLGLLAIADLYLRYQPEFFQAFHTDAGVLSRSFLIDTVGDAWRLTPHLMTGTSAGITALFIIEALCGLHSLDRLLQPDTDERNKRADQLGNQYLPSRFH